MYCLHIRAWASALPSNHSRAMREASERRMATGTDSHAFYCKRVAMERRLPIKLFKQMLSHRCDYETIAQRRPKDIIYRIISIMLIVAFVFNLFSATRYALNTEIWKQWGFTEFLINFEGGFVRRGLLGQGLYYFCSSTGMSFQWATLITCYIALSIVLLFFLKKFSELKYNWWIILSPLFLGTTFAFIRKDFILYCGLIVILMLIKDSVPSLCRRICATLIGIFCLFLHEAFIFWGIPIFSLLLISEKNNRWINISFIILIFIVFGILCFFKGNIITAQMIVDSWNELLPADSLIYYSNNSIGAIGWDSLSTFIMHLKNNTGGNVDALFIRPVFAIAAYYLITNILFVFSYKDKNYQTSQIALSSPRLFHLRST